LLLPGAGPVVRFLEATGIVLEDVVTVDRPERR
jgi:hypothetical protein